MNELKKKCLPLIKFTLFVGILILAIFLRFYKVTSFPPAPYWEEVALGYDAFSILKTGSDHHGNSWPIVAFESFGDWKPSGYFYVLTPFIAIFGLDVWVVRLPSMIAGVLLVLVIGKLVKLIYRVSFTSRKKSPTLGQPSIFVMGLIGTSVATISPWAIQFSRAGWEVNLATFFMTTAVLLGLFFIEKLDALKKSSLVSNFYQLIFLLPIILLLVAATYIYHSARVLAPLLGVGVIWLWFQVQLRQNKTKSSAAKIIKLVKKRWQVILITGFMAGLLFSPIIAGLAQNKISQRFAETSLFSDLSVIEESNFLKDSAGNTWISKIIYHRYALFGREIVKNFADHFDLNFLFISGDSNPRHSTGWTGQLYHIEIVFLLVGIYWLVKNWNKYHGFLIFWLIMGILPAALTKTTPHALRILPVMPVFLIVVSLGIVEVIQKLTVFWASFWTNKNKQPLTQPARIAILWGAVIFIIYIAELAFFWRFYSKIYPKIYSQEWQYGYGQMITKVVSLQEEYPDLPVYITREQGRPAMYYWFYTQTDPREIQALDETAKQDRGEFLEFKNIKFVSGAGEITQKPAIVASSPKTTNKLRRLGANFKLEDEEKIENLGGKVVWWVGVVE